MTSLALADSILSVSSEVVSLCGLAVMLVGGLGLVRVQREARRTRLLGVAAPPGLGTNLVLKRTWAIAAARHDRTTFARATAAMLPHAVIFAGGVLLVGPQVVGDESIAWTVFHVIGAAFFLVLLVHTLWAYGRGRRLLRDSAEAAARRPEDFERGNVHPELLPYRAGIDHQDARLGRVLTGIGLVLLLGAVVVAGLVLTNTVHTLPNVIWAIGLAVAGIAVANVGAALRFGRLRRSHQ